MDCPNCKTPVKFLEIIKINHKKPYTCPTCNQVSKFNHSKKFINIVAAFAGLAGVIFFYSIESYGWLIGLFSMMAMISVFSVIFIKYAKLELIESENESQS